MKLSKYLLNLHTQECTQSLGEYKRAKDVMKSFCDANPGEKHELVKMERLNNHYEERIKWQQECENQRLMDEYRRSCQVECEPDDDCWAAKCRRAMTDWY
jgi:DNA repair ATPase RecN